MFRHEPIYYHLRGSRCRKSVRVSARACPTHRIERRGDLRRHLGMNRSRIVVGVLLLGACGRNPLGVGAGAGSGGSTSGAGGAGGSAGGAMGGTGLPVARIGDDGICGETMCPQGQQCCLSTGRCVAPSSAVAACPLPQPKPAICGGVTCAAGEICCLLSGSCIDPSTAATSGPPPGATTAEAADAAPPTGTSSMGHPCGSDADCLPTQFCSTSTAQSLPCRGPGTCQSRSNCGFSSGMQWCGCDGMTYPDLQTACRAGVRVIATNACGTPGDQGTPGDLGPRDPVIYCGTSDQCPQGQECCGITSRCYDPSVPYLCTFPPPGTSLSCLEDRQCLGSQFCFGAGCSGEGGCVSPGSCTGELTPVCGCDGKSYTSAGCARAAPTRVAHDGVCASPDAGP